MNAKLQKLISSQTEEELVTIQNEIMRAVESNPAAWRPELANAIEECSSKRERAFANWKMAAEEVDACDAIYTDATPKFSADDPEMKRKWQALIEAKADAFDKFFENERASAIVRALNELYDDAGQCQYILETTGKLPVVSEPVMVDAGEGFPF